MISNAWTKMKQRASFMLTAVVDEEKNILGESLRNQTQLHRELGGVIPIVARDLHKENIENVVADALSQARKTLRDLDAIAVTIKPGLPLSLLVGLNHAQALAKGAQLPLIPIHHMEAHALTARLTNQVDFPFMVFLMSGGHCLLAVASGVNDFKLLGTSRDTSPGDMLDKTARRLRLKTIPELTDLCGGAAIEKLAMNGDPKKFKFPTIMTHSRNCDFSFCGLQFAAKSLIEHEEQQYGIGAANVIPSVEDFCASLQYATLDHMSKRLYRAFMFSEIKGLIPEENRVLVLSGGVASNLYYRDGLARIADLFNCRIVCPPPRLCTDNGVMIAWNGIEKLRCGIDICSHDTHMEVKNRVPFGESLIDEVHSMNIKVPSTSRLLKMNSNHYE